MTNEGKVFYVFDQDRRLKYINKGTVGATPSADAIGLSYQEIYGHDQKVLEAVGALFDKALSSPGVAIDFAFEMPTMQGLATFREQLVYMKEAQVYMGAAQMESIV